MKSKDVILRLLELDPTGEVEVMASGAITLIDSLPAYYDGALEYIDNKGNFVMQRDGKKICIYSSTLEDFVYDQDGRLNKVRFEGMSKEQAYKWKRQCLKYSKECKETFEKINNEWFVRLVKKLCKGYKVLQAKKIKPLYNDGFYFFKAGKVIDKEKEHFCTGYFRVIVENEELFECNEDFSEEYREYHLKREYL